jgi:hypothetical protein
MGVPAMTRADRPEGSPPERDLAERLRAELHEQAERVPVDTPVAWAAVERRLRRERVRRAFALVAGVAAVVAAVALVPRLVPSPISGPLGGQAPVPAPSTTRTPPPGASVGGVGADLKVPELRVDGLGEFTFGAGPAVVLGRLNLQLGTPTVDTGWVDGGWTPYGTCPGARARAVTFGRLTVLLSDGPTRLASAGHQHLIAWVVEEPQGPSAGQGTPAPIPVDREPVTAGQPLRKLRDVYGDHVRVLDPGDRFEIGPPISDGRLKGLPRFNGTLRGVGEAATIVTLRAGVPCDGRDVAPAARGQP